MLPAPLPLRFEPLVDVALGRRPYLAEAHAALLPHIPEGDHDPAHMAMIWHGRRTCHARAPACESCALLSLCIHGQKKTSVTDTDTDG